MWSIITWIMKLQRDHWLTHTLSVTHSFLSLLIAFYGCEINKSLNSHQKCRREEKPLHPMIKQQGLVILFTSHRVCEVSLWVGASVFVHMCVWCVCVCGVPPGSMAPINMWQRHTIQKMDWKGEMKTWYLRDQPEGERERDACDITKCLERNGYKIIATLCYKM